MSETTPPPPPSEPGPGAPPPAPPVPPSPTGGATGGGQPNTLMIILSYFGLFALIPLLVEKDDPEIQWHAKHGLVLFAAEFVVWLALTGVTMVFDIGCLGCATGLLSLGLGVGVLVLHVTAIIKGVQGGRLIIPGLSDYADKF